MELQGQLMKTVTIVDDCWIRGIEGNPEEYSHIRIDGILYHAHRVSYELFVGPVTPGFDVCHTCDRKRCIRPEHLFLGTEKDNIQDSINKGRFHYGVMTGSSVLNDELVLKIRQQYKEGVCSQEDLAELYGVGHSTIGAIVNYKTWRHLS